MQLRDFFITLMNRNRQGQSLRLSWKNAYIDRDEFKESILCQDRHYDFVACFRVVVKQGHATGVCLYKQFGCVEERCRGIFAKHRGWFHPELFLNFFVHS